MKKSIFSQKPGNFFRTFFFSLKKFLKNYFFKEFPPPQKSSKNGWMHGCIWSFFFKNAVKKITKIQEFVMTHGAFTTFYLAIVPKRTKIVPKRTKKGPKRTKKDKKGPKNDGKNHIIS